MKTAVKAEHRCDPPGGATFIWPGSASLSASPGGKSRAPASSPPSSIRTAEEREGERGQLGSDVENTEGSLLTRELIHLHLMILVLSHNNNDWENKINRNSNNNNNK